MTDPVTNMMRFFGCLLCIYGLVILFLLIAKPYVLDDFKTSRYGKGKIPAATSMILAFIMGGIFLFGS